ncbi:pilus assembly protein TadG-related protein [Streptomyces sp. NPDC053367]|uniref:pilus assembly protein TadG-related protein n=1 Tax=Streptomyces sp. NPDC053367 TaxID=3365700 RepID=UPI0037D19309
MTRLRSRSDAGQAFPIYITVVAGLLFLAFAYLAVGQAAANRNGAQTAADAAALAAAQDARDQLARAWAENVLDPTKWQIIFDGKAPLDDACWRAYDLAALNNAEVEDCGTEGPLRYLVLVESNEPVGDSIVPNTENQYSKASATAVVEPLCQFDPLGADAADDELPRLMCEDRFWDLDPEDLDELPKPEDLFDVHLAD